MIRIFLIIFTTLILNSCNAQKSGNSKGNDIDSLSKEIPNGIVYFSKDNGLNWINSSNGLPENIRIGLGGIATSNQFIGIATKDMNTACFLH
jgi:uncharacterized membrane protein YadS